MEVDPQEEYRQEYLRKKWERQHEEKLMQEERNRALYKFIRYLCYPFLLFSILLIADYYLPSDVFKEVPNYGWQTSSGGRKGPAIYRTYMETPSHVFRVPPDEHIDYNYSADRKKLVMLEITPMFGTVKKVGFEIADPEYRTYDSLGTIYSTWIPMPYVLFLLSLIIVRKEKYEFNFYWLSYFAVVCFAVVLLMMIW